MYVPSRGNLNKEKACHTNSCLAYKFEKLVQAFDLHIVLIMLHKKYDIFIVVYLCSKTGNEKKIPCHINHLPLQNGACIIFSSLSFFYFIVLYLSLSEQPPAFITECCSPQQQGRETAYESHPSPFGNQEALPFICLIT